MENLGSTVQLRYEIMPCCCIAIVQIAKVEFGKNNKGPSQVLYCFCRNIIYLNKQPW
jgi:hypothetical protein